jgi:hypothetical protein
VLSENFSNINDPKIWELSKHDDIILSKDDTDEYRVLVNYENYKALKELISQLKSGQLIINDSDEFDLNPHLEDLNAIVKNGQFEDISNQPHYFRKMAQDFIKNEKI